MRGSCNWRAHCSTQHTGEIPYLFPAFLPAMLLLAVKNLEYTAGKVSLPVVMSKVNLRGGCEHKHDQGPHSTQLVHKVVKCGSNNV